MTQTDVAQQVQLYKKLVPKGQDANIYLRLIKEQVLKPDKNGNQRSNEDFMLFLYTCKRTGLDPLTNQIYAVFRWDSTLGREKMSIQAGIDGMRLVAMRTGQYAGQDDIIYSPENESAEYPTKATCTIYKIIADQKVAFTASARWSEYVQTFKRKTGEVEIGGMWAKMPYLMLGKCAEALALRKAFPNELSGLYTEEEMPRVSSVLENLPAPTPREQVAVSDEQTPDISKLRKDLKKGLASEEPEANETE